MARTGDTPEGVTGFGYSRREIHRDTYKKMSELRETAPRGHRTRWWRHAAAMVITALLVAFVSLVMDTVTEATLASDMARRTVARLFAPFDGWSYQQTADASASDRLLVLDLGQVSLDRYGGQWPLRYGQHARLLQRLREAGPRAVFIDFQFQAARADDSLPQLLDALCDLHAAGIPVFLAAGSEGAEGQLRPELEGLRAADGQPCFRKVAVTYRPDAADHITWAYPLETRLGEQTLPSAALALAGVLRGAPLTPGHHSTLGLTWSSRDGGGGPAWQRASSGHEEAADAAEAHGAHEASADDTRYCRAPSFWDIVPLQAFFAHLVPGLHPDSRPNCPMHHSLEVAELTRPMTAEERDALQARIHGRAVLIGGSFDANDFVRSPLHGDIPGVYLHAQAADNLLQRGEHWLHPEIAEVSGHALEPLVLFVCFFLVSLSFLLLKVGVRAIRRGLASGWRLVRHTPQPPTDETSTGAHAAAAPHAAEEGGVDVAEVAAREGLMRRALIALGQQLGTELLKLGGQTLFFYAALIVVLPMSWVMERLLGVSLIGYAFILVFALLGEALMRTDEIVESMLRALETDPA